jgi:tetratricopeptide (TPR) repeat protein
MRLCVLGLALMLAGPAAAKPVTMTAEELLRFGEAAMLRGYAAQALSVTDALLARDGGDVQALILRAQALRMLDRLPESEAAARTAWQRAEAPAPRFLAATALAQALSLQGQRLRAQYWLRQAAEHAPSAGAQAQALADLRYVRGETPLRLQVDLSAQPSDNVNGGARVDSVTVAGITLPLPAKLTALSGLSYSLGISGEYRIAAAPGADTALTFGLQRSGAVLSEAAKALGGQAHDLDFLHLGAGVIRKGAWGSLRFDLGRNWYGGQDLSATYGVSGTMVRRVGAARVELSAGLQREARFDLDAASSTQGRLGAAVAMAGPKGDTWRIAATLMTAEATSDVVQRQEAGMSLDWQAAEKVAGFGLGASVGVTGARYASGRRDGRLRASLEAEFPTSFAGFAPVLSLDWSRGNSNVLVYDTESLGLGLTLRSRF